MEKYLIPEQYENNLITAGDLRIITSVHPENIKDERVQNKLKTLGKGSNPFVRNLTIKLIED